MIHSPEVLAFKELSDEQVAFTIRCCGDPMTDSSHTVSVLAPLPDDPRTHEQIIQEKKAEVAARHAAKLAWREKFSPAVNATLPE